MTSIKIPKVVAVTGAAGYIGQRLLERLGREAGIEKIVATDNRPLDNSHDKVIFFQQEITSSLTQAFKQHKVEAVVHLAFALRQTRSRKAGEKVNINGAASLLQSCDEAEVKRIIQLSSSTVYGPHSDNPAFLQENDPVRPPYQFQYAWDKAFSEGMFREYGTKHPNSDVSILRSCIVMGPNANNFITSALLKPLLIGIKGCNPPMQFIHEHDLVEIIWKFVCSSHPGVFNIAGRSAIKWANVVKASKRSIVWLSPKLIYGITALAWFFHLQNDSPPKGIDFIRWAWVISTDRVEEELNYRCKFTSEEALRSFLDTRYSAS